MERGGAGYARSGGGFRLDLTASPTLESPSSSRRRDWPSTSSRLARGSSPSCGSSTSGTGTGT